MAALDSPPFISPLGSPEAYLSPPANQNAFQRVPQHDPNTPDPEKRSIGNGQGDAGLGIGMTPMATPPTQASPVYRNDLPSKGGTYSPLVSFADSRPMFSRTPTSNYSLSSGLARLRNHRTETLIAHRSTQATQWRIHWRTPAMLVASFFVGILLTLAQHFLYRYLDHTAEPDEGQRIRMVLYGRALAYFAKVAFGGCCLLVYRQRIWRTFRHEALSVLSIDQLFQASEDASIFLNWEALTKARIPVLMALIYWLIPLATIIFSPSALTFGDTLETGNRTLMVPTLNFTAETEKDWRVPYVGPNQERKISLMYYNTTDASATEDGWFDYYDMPSADVTRISMMMAYNLMDHPLTRQDARMDSCGGNYNCSFSINFVGPGYKCEEVARGIGDEGKLKEYDAPFNTSMLVPEGRHVYLAETNAGAYARPQAENLGLGGVPEGAIPDDLGVFKSDPPLWVGYSKNTSVPEPADSPWALNWTHRYEPAILRCIHHEANYTVVWNYTEPFFHVNSTWEFLDPIIETNFTHSDDGSVDYDNPQPTSNFVSPRPSPPDYKLTAAYYTLGASLRAFFAGKIQYQAPKPGPPYAIVDSEITRTRLWNVSTDDPVHGLEAEIQLFYTDMLLSLLSMPQMLVVAKTRTDVFRSRYQSTFIYDARRFWACFAPVIGLTLCILGFGAYTILKDGTTFSVGFSRILVTTRNGTLDELARGACLGNDPFPNELMNTKLRFGVLNENGDSGFSPTTARVEHCAFGVEEEVVDIQRGGRYAGLPSSRKGEKEGKMKAE